MRETTAKNHINAYTVGDIGTLKYYKQVESTEYGKANNQIIPMIRMSEVYYIAAEAIYTEGDLLKICLLYTSIQQFLFISPLWNGKYDVV